MNTRLSKSVRLAIAAGVASAAVFSNVSFAQEQTSAEDEADTVEKIQVTGSRIKRTGIDTIRPSVDISADIIEKNAFTNVADALAEVPLFGVGNSPNGQQNGFTVGTNFSNLFDLGTQRTLTLVNGRRFVSANVPSNFGSVGGLQVDLNAIPAGLIRNVEVVPLAGAAVYGSDAIAGVVNISLRDDYEGFEVSSQVGQTEQGDGNTRQIQALVGGNFDDDRGNIVLSVEINRQDGLLRSRRPDIFSTNPDFVNFGQQGDLNGDGEVDTISRIVDGGQVLQALVSGGNISTTGRFRPSVGDGALADGNFYQFANNGNLEACTPGDTPAGSTLFAYGGTCGEDFFDNVTQVRSPLERTLVTVLSHYDITDYIRFSQEINFANSEATELVNQGGFNGIFAGTGGALDFDADNPFLNDQARGILQANDVDNFVLNRFNNDLVAGGQDATENLTFRYFGGFSGDFTLADRDFSWDVGAVFGKVDVETRDVGIVDTRFVNALDAVRLDETSLAPVLANLVASDSDLNGDGIIDVNDALAQFNTNGGGAFQNQALGDIACQVNIDNAAGNLSGPSAPASGNGVTDEDLPFVNGCAPLNLFGDGVQSAEALAFINGGPTFTNSDIEQRVITANIGGEIFDLPGGAVNLVVGYEERNEKARFSPGLGVAVPLTRSAASVPIEGELQTTEYYAEALVPITNPQQNIPGLHLLEFEGSIRSVKNEITGPEGDSSDDTVTTFEIGTRWSPIEDIAFRATYSEAIRTPSLVELFTPQTTNFVSGADPCDSRFVNSGPNPTQRRANCIAAGITDPDNFTSIITNQTIRGLASGNTELTPEESESFLIGAVIQPRWIEDLVISLDYYDIKIDDRIQAVEFDDLASTCFDSANFPNEAACSTFTRDAATGQVINAIELQLNAASSEFSAFNYRVQYDFEVANALKLLNSSWGNGDYGSLDLNFNVLRNLNSRVQVSEGVIPDQDVGTFRNSEIEGTFDFTYTIGDFRAFWRINYENAPFLDVEGDQLFQDQEGDELITRGSQRYFHNMSLQYAITEGTTIQLAANNVFSRNPSRVDLAAGFFDFRDILGTTYSLRVRSQF